MTSMENESRKQHWENVYETKNPDQVSWTQEIPQTALDFIASFNVDKQAKIIDIGGGDSKLVDHLLELGYENISVLDISAKALEKAKSRLGAKAQKVTWIVSDILDFEPQESYDVWHDRAAFHFLTKASQIDMYQAHVNKYANGFLIISTFSDNGPLKCSGLEISQYNQNTLSRVFEANFEHLKCVIEDHSTPFATTQNFVFCSFKRKNI